METSAPASFHACRLAASRKTTRTFFFCVSSVSATTLPVFPEAPSTINIGEPPWLCATPVATRRCDLRHRDLLGLRRMNRHIHSCPRRQLARLPAGYLVCERNSVVRIRTQVGMSLEVPERLCHLNSPRKERGVLFRWDLPDG